MTRSGVSCARPLGRVLGASWPGSIRWLESDLRSGQRREHRPNVPALVLRRVVASGRGHRPFTPNNGKALLLYYFNRIKTTINRIKTTINRIKQTSKAVGVSKVFDAGVATAPACPARQGDGRQPPRLRSERTPPSQTVTWTRLLIFTAGRRTHTMACAHSELSTGHCGRRIGTKIFQEVSCSPSIRPAERQVRGVVLSKEQGSLPPSAGNTAAPSRFGGLISASFLCRLGFHVDVSRTGIRLAVLKAFKRPFPKVGAAGSTAGAAAFVPVHTLSACMPCAPLASSLSFHAGKFPNVRTMPSNFSCPVRRRRQGETLKGGRIRSAVTRTARA